jgi:MerR family copper efflux transcriptional regulator
MSKLLRTTDVAHRLGVSAVYVRQLADEGTLPAEKTEGGYRIFRAEDVERLAIERQQRKQAKGQSEPHDL